MRHSLEYVSTIHFAVAEVPLDFFLEFDEFRFDLMIDVALRCSRLESPLRFRARVCHDVSVLPHSLSRPDDFRYLHAPFALPVFLLLLLPLHHELSYLIMSRQVAVVWPWVQVPFFNLSF